LILNSNDTRCLRVTALGIRDVLFVLVLMNAARAADATTLRVLTYNIHHSQGRDGVFDLERIASVINAANPDLVALQELDQGNTRSGVDVFQLHRLAELTGLQGFFGKTIEFQGGEYGNGVLVRRGLHVIATVNRAMPSPGGGEARGVMEVGISLDGVNTTPEIRLFATHFTAGADETSRLNQAAFINSLATSSEVPALLAGDLNSTPSSAPMQSLLEQWKDPTASRTTISRATQIDFVLLRSPQWRIVEPGNFTVNFTTSAASDHYPYLTAVTLIPEPSTQSIVAGCSFLVCRACRRGQTDCRRRAAPCHECVTPPCAKDDLGGSSSEAQAAFSCYGRNEARPCPSASPKHRLISRVGPLGKRHSACR
jgi:endonuclease/exonuclease/phosphatase family metal-dependent hydrolase